VALGNNNLILYDLTNAKIERIEIAGRAEL
jgi:hypothetical protein